MSYEVVSDDLRAQLRSLGHGEPPDLVDLRSGKTLFWNGDAQKRIASIRSSLTYARSKGHDKRYLVTRRAIVEGKPGVVAWLEERA